ncbi:MAG TPA: hypothetical protein VIO11_01110 [Candidatus Methanoperedens sp.]
MRFPYILFLLIVFIFSRIPFLDLGFSSFESPTDQDVLAMVNSAYLLHYSHIYAVSRFPGSPVYEIINSFLIEGGWLATNSATMIISLMTVILFGKILKIFDIKNRTLLLVTFMFIPVIWINSTITMDYMWGLAFILLAFYLTFRGKYNYSGIALAFAAGIRITSLVMLIPLVYWMLQKKTGSKRICSFLLTSILFSIIYFSPVLYTYGLEFLKYYPRIITFNEVYYGFTTQLLSIPALSLLLISLVIARDIPQKDPVFNVSLIVLFIYALLFILHPSKPAYLIPAVPFGMIALSKSFPRLTVIMVCVLVILNGIISIGIQNNEEKFNIGYGSVIKNFEERKKSVPQSTQYLESLSEALQKG